jgi:anti-anti-sigma factor
MDIRVRTIIAFTPLLVLLVGLLIALQLIDQRDRQLLDEQRAAADDLFDTQVMGLNLLMEYVAIGQIARDEISLASDRYTRPHIEVARMFAENTGFTAAGSIDQQATIIYTALGKRYDSIIAFSQTGDLVTAQQIYDEPQTLTLLDNLLSINITAREMARSTIDDANQRVATSHNRASQLIFAAVAFGILITLGLSWMLITRIARPIEQLTVDTEQHVTGSRSGQLRPVGNIRQLRRLRDAFQNLLDTNESRQTAIQQNLDELNERIVREERLRETVQALSVPVVPLHENMLLLPLIGYLDDRRAAELTSSMLEAIHRTRARAVVIDITGLAALDSAGTRTLTQTFSAARLLGCKVFLVGVQSNQAITLAEDNLATSGVTIARDIPSVLEIAHRMV